ncbi:mucin-17-like [Physella acuta]|uniref:mucin-17-like n=1 Tax=Physella acuta TaxID=109671 RepID=UPI0027DCCFCC|nr:mucin-17-like [Physella acuta]
MASRNFAYGREIAFMLVVLFMTCVSMPTDPASIPGDVTLPAVGVATNDEGGVAASEDYYESDYEDEEKTNIKEFSDKGGNSGEIQARNFENVTHDWLETDGHYTDDVTTATVQEDDLTGGEGVMGLGGEGVRGLEKLADDTADDRIPLRKRTGLVMSTESTQLNVSMVTSTKVDELSQDPEIYAKRGSQLTDQASPRVDEPDVDESPGVEETSGPTDSQTDPGGNHTEEMTHVTHPLHVDAGQFTGPVTSGSTHSGHDSRSPTSHTPGESHDFVPSGHPGNTSGHNGQSDITQEQNGHSDNTTESRDDEKDLAQNRPPQTVDPASSESLHPDLSHNNHQPHYPVDNNTNDVQDVTHEEINNVDYQAQHHPTDIEENIVDGSSDHHQTADVDNEHGVSRDSHMYFTSARSEEVPDKTITSTVTDGFSTANRGTTLAGGGVTTSGVSTHTMTSHARISDDSLTTGSGLRTTGHPVSRSHAHTVTAWPSVRTHPPGDRRTRMPTTPTRDVHLPSVSSTVLETLHPTDEQDAHFSNKDTTESTPVIHTESTAEVDGKTAIPSTTSLWTPYTTTPSPTTTPTPSTTTPSNTPSSTPPVHSLLTTTLTSPNTITTRGHSTTGNTPLDTTSPMANTIESNVIGMPTDVSISSDVSQSPGFPRQNSSLSFVELRFGMSWLSFCKQQSPIKGELVEIMQASQREITTDQIFLLNVDERRCADVTEDISVHLYLVNKSHQYDRGLTLDCGQVLRSSTFPRDSIIRSKLLDVRIYDAFDVNASKPATEKIDTNPFADPGVTVAVILAVVGGACCLGLLAIQIFVRHRNRDRHVFNPTFNRSCSSSSMDSIQLSSVTKSRPNSGLFNPGQEITDSLEPSHPMNFTQLSDFCCSERHIAQEFETIPYRMPRLSVVPKGEEDKNRYANILPLAHTRVKLVQDGPELRTSYINANYITGPNKNYQYYIATQAPTEGTITDFWTMVWQQQSKAIVMLTQLQEDGHVKCASYWPELVGKSAAQKHGDFLIELKQKDIHQEYIVSCLEINHLRKIEKREVHHFWYTCWPSHGVPEPISLVKLVLDTRPKYEHSGYPLIVHCSPGTGRTCTFVALDLCMSQFESGRNVDVLRTVYNMRQERAGAVQNKEQYALLYHAINEYATIVMSPVVSAASSATTLHALLST